MYSPQYITKLSEDEVFVFGSNLSGFHGAGSAGFAMRGTTKNTWRTDQEFLDIKSGKNPDKRGKWAVYGVGQGFQTGKEGSSYAIATVERPGFQGKVDIKHFTAQFVLLCEFAMNHPELKFLVVKLGANRAEGGFSWLGSKNVWSVYQTLNKLLVIPSNIHLPE